MKRLILLVGLITSGPLYAQQSVNLDALDLPPEETASSFAGLGLHLYADFDVDWQAPPGADAFWSFNQNHRDLLVQTAPDSTVDLLIDLLLPTQLFGMGIPLALPFPALEDVPVLGSSHLWAGILQVPFGEFSFHHLYGGREFRQGGLVPDLWTDAGVQWAFRPWPGLAVDLFLSNGFSDPNQIFLSPKGPGNVTGSPKAWAARVRQDLAPGWYISLSGFRNPYGLDSEPSKVLSMGGLDLSAKSGPLTYRFAGLLALVQGNSEWNRSGWYGEVQYLFSPALFLRARGGTMQPDSRSPVLDTGDINLGVIWKTGVVEWDLTTFADAPLASGWIAGTSTKYQVLLKVLYTI